MQQVIQYPGGTKATRNEGRIVLLVDFQIRMVRAACIRRARSFARSTAGATVMLQSAAVATPQNLLELAQMLRDPEANKRSPYGHAFEEHCSTED